MSPVEILRDYKIFYISVNLLYGYGYLSTDSESVPNMLKSW